MKIKILLWLLIALLTPLCYCALGPKVIKTYQETGDSDIFWHFFYFLSKSSPKNAIYVFSKTISLESISPYFSCNDFFRFYPNENVIKDFAANNAFSLNIPADAFRPFVGVIEDTFSDSKTIKVNFPPQINFKTMDNLKTAFIRISRCGYNSQRDTALVYLEYYCTEWDYGTLCVYAHNLMYWELVKERYLWTNEKKRIRDTKDPAYSAQTAFFDTIPEGLANKFQTFFVVSNIEEDTVTYRSQEELYDQSLPVLDTIHNCYRYLFKTPRPKGSIDFKYYIDCAGQIYNFQISRDDIGNDSLLNKAIEMFGTLRYPDKVRTNKCGKVKVDCLLIFNGA